MTSGQINCPAPLPEGPADARLAKLLVPAPYVVPEKKVKKKTMGTRKSAQRPEVSDSPTNPGSRSTTRRARPWADCIVIFGVRRSCARKEHYELLWYPNTYDLARGLALCGPSSSPSSALVE